MGIRELVQVGASLAVRHVAHELLHVRATHLSEQDRLHDAEGGLHRGLPASVACSRRPYAETIMAWVSAS